MTDVERITQLRTLAVERAVANLGFGETEGNNRGLFIEEIGGKYLSEEDPDWCALFAGHCWRRAYEIAFGWCGPSSKRVALLRTYGGHDTGWLYRRRGVPEPGALRLVTALGKVGCHFTDPDLAAPGDLVLWKRPGGHHVAIIEDVDDALIHTIEGNVGRYPAKVKRLTHDVTKEPHFKRFASLRTAAML